MKWLLYSLLLVNLALFVWHYQESPTISPVANTVEQDKAGAVSLVLLSEFVDKVEQPEIEENQCFSLGPFINKKQSALAAKIIRTENAFEAESRLRKDAKRKAYWVLLPPAESRALAKENISLLKKKNVRDYFLVATGDQTNAVSLGVFRKFESAHRRIKQMQGMGFTPTVEKVNLPKKEYWLEWNMEPENKLGDDILGRLEKIQANLELLERSCS